MASPALETPGVNSLATQAAAAEGPRHTQTFPPPPCLYKLYSPGNDVSRVPGGRESLMKPPPPPPRGTAFQVFRAWTHADSPQPLQLPPDVPNLMREAGSPPHNGTGDTGAVAKSEETDDDRFEPDFGQFFVCDKIARFSLAAWRWVPAEVPVGCSNHRVGHFQDLQKVCRISSGTIRFHISCSSPSALCFVVPVFIAVLCRQGPGFRSIPAPPRSSNPKEFDLHVVHSVDPRAGHLLRDSKNLSTSTLADTQAQP